MNNYESATTETQVLVLLHFLESTQALFCVTCSTPAVRVHPNQGKIHILRVSLCAEGVRGIESTFSFCRSLRE